MTQVTVFTSRSNIGPGYDVVIDAGQLAASTGDPSPANRLLGIKLAYDALRHAFRIAEFKNVALVHPDATDAQILKYVQSGYKIEKGRRIGFSADASPNMRMVVGRHD